MLRCIPSESESESRSVMSDSLQPMDWTVYGILQARIWEWVAFPFSRKSSQPRPPALQVDSLPAEPQGKPKNKEWVAYPFFTNWVMREALYFSICFPSISNLLRDFIMQGSFGKVNLSWLSCWVREM